MKTVKLFFLQTFHAYGQLVCFTFFDERILAVAENLLEMHPNVWTTKYIS